MTLLSLFCQNLNGTFHNVVARQAPKHSDRRKQCWKAYCPCDRHRNAVDTEGDLEYPRFKEGCNHGGALGQNFKVTVDENGTITV